MPLTPEDVRNKRFTPVRLREGYDMGEVDQFLDEIETELERLSVENEELRVKVSAASSGSMTGVISSTDSGSSETAGESAQAAAEPESTGPESTGDESTAAGEGENALEETQPHHAYGPAAPVEDKDQPVGDRPVGDRPVGDRQSGSRRSEGTDEDEPDDLEQAKAAAHSGSIGDASSAAARLLEIASTNADQLIEQARDEAQRVVTEAQTKADQIVTEARGKADRLETDSRIRAQKLDEETNERRQQALDAIERERSELQRDVEHLRAYEREYRARLKNYFQKQLEGLEAQDQSADYSASAPDETPTSHRVGSED